ncbi:MAG: bifunctional isocitrate dehydrogenase kinase/phosphatase [Candidatus Thiodiazotropha sp.]
MTHDLPQQIAQAILTGFDRHFSFFQEISSAARQRFERADWMSVREASSKRISFYDIRVQEAIAKVRTNFGIKELDEGLWQEVKLRYTALLLNHSRPELAETFFNSVFCRLFERKYYDNDKIFIVSQVNRQELAARYRVYMSFQDEVGGIYADTLLTQHRRVEAVFSFARAYFMVKTPVPTVQSSSCAASCRIKPWPIST